MARLKSSTESLPSCRTRVSNFKASCVFRLILGLFFATGAGESVPNFQETMHIDAYMCTKPKDPKVLFNGRKSPDVSFKSLGFESRSLGHVMLYIAKYVYALACTCHVYCPRSWSTPSATPQAEWGSLQFLQLGGLPLKPYGKPQTLATWPFHQLPRFWLLSGSPTLEIRLHGNMRFKFDWSIERREFGNDEWSASNLRQSKSVSEPHTCQ